MSKLIDIEVSKPDSSCHWLLFCVRLWPMPQIPREQASCMMTQEDSHFQFDTGLSGVGLSDAGLEMGIDACHLADAPSVGLVSQVIAALRDRKPIVAGGPRQHALDHLVEAVVASAGFDPRQMFADLAAHRVTEVEAVDVYIPHAAEVLGVRWLEDDLSFADVTIAALRLQAMVRSMSWAPFAGVDAMSALIVLPESEQHFLGGSVLMSQLERLGLSVEMSMCEPQSKVVSRILHDRPEVILFTCSGAAALASITETVQNILRTVAMPPVLALGGPIVSQKDSLKETTGVDIVTCEITDVVEVCASKRNAQSGR
ncbi:hypothetical protein [Ascidiaceihabitans sp.]|uniref:hypothetical protein n=2 Tax=Ascidiaceihabitans sp. TaxID=1872644 RepID=UPI0032979C84